MGEGYFYEEWEVVMSSRVPPVPIDSFIDEYYSIPLYRQNNPFITI